MKACVMTGIRKVEFQERRIPEIKPVISFYFVLCMINMLSWLFNYVYVMTKGGPMNSTYVMDFYIYQLGVKFTNYGMASTLAVILLGITFLLVGAQAGIQHYVFPEEEMQIRETFHVTQCGVFNCPAAEIECLYAPHYRGNDGHTIPLMAE